MKLWGVILRGYKYVTDERYTRFDSRFSMFLKYHVQI